MIINGKSYSHIINPKTGYPTDSKIKSVTLVGNNPAMLDAYATAFLIMELKNSISLIENNKIGALFIFDDGKMYATDLFKNKIIKEEYNENN